MRIRFSARAFSHLLSISEHIARENSEAAQKVGRSIYETIEILRLFPEAGRVGKSTNTYELVVPRFPYIVVYQVSAGAEPVVIILGIFHCKQDR